MCTCHLRYSYYDWLSGSRSAFHCFSTACNVSIVVVVGKLCQDTILQIWLVRLPWKWTLNKENFMTSNPLTLYLPLTLCLKQSVLRSLLSEPEHLFAGVGRQSLVSWSRNLEGREEHLPAAKLRLLR